MTTSSVIPMSDEWALSLRHLVKYPDCNATKNLFGGLMLAWIDEGAAMFAATLMRTDRLVTAHMDGIDFKVPVPKGSVCSVFCKMRKRGRTSLTVDVLVTTSRFSAPDVELEVARTTLVFVALDENNSPTEW